METAGFRESRRLSRVSGCHSVHCFPTGTLTIIQWNTRQRERAREGVIIVAQDESLLLFTGKGQTCGLFIVFLFLVCAVVKWRRRNNLQNCLQVLVEYDCIEGILY